MAQTFETRKELELPIAPEHVWQVIATPEGQAGWSPDPYAESPGDTVVEEYPSRFVVRTP